MARARARTKTCFVIAPIGEDKSDTRQRSDQILKHVIGPVTAAVGYKTTRADKIAEPGIITSQIIQRLTEADLVIADLTDSNANVFYELAIRHGLKKPVIHMIQTGQRLPFDVAAARTIYINHQDLDSAEEARKQLTRHIESVETDPSLVDNPISAAIDFRGLKQSENLLEKSIGEVLDLLKEIREIQIASQTGIGTWTFPVTTMPSLGQPFAPSLVGGSPGVQLSTITDLPFTLKGTNPPTPTKPSGPRTRGETQ